MLKLFSPTPCTRLILLLFLNLSTILLWGQPLHVAGFNINSAVASKSIIAKQMAEHKDISIWGLSESTNDWTTYIMYNLKQSGNGNFKVIKGTTGNNTNHLQIYYDTDKYHLISHTELDYINKNKLVRAPLVAKFRDNSTDQIFLFMVNHLYRSNSQARIQQSEQLNLWIKKQVLPVIAVGDYNYDMSPYDTSDHDIGYDKITKENVVKWIKPSILLPSQCSKYKSILDFIFVSNKVIYDSAYSIISYPEDDYCGQPKFSDHRPVTAMIDLY